MNKSIQYIEEQLGVTLEKDDYHNKNQVNTYHVHTKNNTVSSIVLQNLTIKNINVLSCISKHLHSLTLINCTVTHFSEIYNFEGLCNLTLDNVIINDLDKLHPYCNPNINAEHRSLDINLKNMEVEHLSMFTPMGNELMHLFITNCTLHNFYEVNQFPKLYDLRLDKVKIKKSKNDVIYQSHANRNFTWLSLYNMEFTDIDFFIPITNGVHGIRLYSCKIGSISSLTKLPHLNELEIDSTTTVYNKELPVSIPSSFYIKECIVGENRENEKAVVDLKNLTSVMPYIQSLTFSQYVSNSTNGIENFTQLNKLTFQYSSALLQDFIPIAPQIKMMLFEHSEFTDSKTLHYFTALEHVEFYSYPHQHGLKDLKELLLLKKQLKKLKIDEDEVENLEAIKEFTALESLKLCDVKSIKTVKNIVELQKLSKLRVYITIEPEPTKPIAINLKQLKNLEVLDFMGANSYHFTGFKQLTKLKKLVLDCECTIDDISELHRLEYLTLEKSIDVNRLPNLPSLKTLVLEVNKEYEINSLEHLNNLENLKIDNTAKIQLGSLPKLKVLYIKSDLDIENTTSFDNLPNLEQLDLSCMALTMVNKLDKLQNLKILDLSENDLKSIEGLQYLNSLEQLNLYANELTDIRVLNMLPNLKEVNLSGNAAENDELLSQLHKPEIALFLGLPHVPFWIWKD